MFSNRKSCSFGQNSEKKWVVSSLLLRDVQDSWKDYFQVFCFVFLHFRYLALVFSNFETQAGNILYICLHTFVYKYTCIFTHLRKELLIKSLKGKITWILNRSPLSEILSVCVNKDKANPKDFKLSFPLNGYSICISALLQSLVF